MENICIYENHIIKIARLLTKDTHLRKDLEQEMRLAIFKSSNFYDTTFNAHALWIARKRALDYLRKFHRGEIPFGSAEDIDNLLYKQDEVD